MLYNVPMNRVEVLRFDFLESRAPVVAAFTTRKGGESGPPFATLNLGLNTGDAPEKVLANRRRVAEVLAISLDSWVVGEQVHGDGVAVITRSEAGRGTTTSESSLKSTDALVTEEKGLALVAFFADCVPVYIVDPVRQVIGLAHAGWRGTRLRIAARTVEVMQQKFAASPDGCLALLGPSIGPCCYEVGPEVAGEFAPEFLKPHKGRWLLDLWKANMKILLQAGIKEANIHITGICTCCHPELFYSYRRDGGRTGRMGAFLCLTA
ncbi:MAG: purine-nucleoside/S-methyl-5-thioadenosine phosphorylase / adenosine deaminase [Clostridia bacterium]|nr:purine-nucleoside/S-methyl-5-thioadenosine phosphorylase / adenosine deaminase [Clostridia bacterium]